MSHWAHNWSFQGQFLQVTETTNSVKALKLKMVCFDIKDQSQEER